MFLKEQQCPSVRDRSVCWHKISNKLLEINKKTIRNTKTVCSSAFQMNNAGQKL